MNSYEHDRKWSDLWIPHIIAIVRAHVLVIAEPEEDMCRATDLMTFKVEGFRLAARIRREGYAKQFPRQFTIRSQRDSGAETELAKILKGWGEWFFYGHEHGSNIWPWYLINLQSFRIQFAMRGLAPERVIIKCGQRSNGDGTVFFWFDIDSFRPKPALLIAESGSADPSMEIPF